MRWLTALLAVVFLGAGVVCASPTILYHGQWLEVWQDDPMEISTPYGDRGRFTLLITGLNGFKPSSFDGVMRDGVINGATGITGDDLFTPGYESRFLDDPADLLSVDTNLLPGYVNDPDALTGLFAISEPSAISQLWSLAEITAASGTTVSLDFTIGEVGGSRTEYVGFTCDAPGEPQSVNRPGDADGDDDVDLDDFVILKNHWGKSVFPGLGADFDNNGWVDLDDFVILKSNFGTMATTALPEPSTFVLGAVGWLLWRRRRTGSRLRGRGASGAGGM